MSTASQRFLRISCDPAVYYNVNKRPPHWNSEAFWNVSYLHDFCSEKWLAPHTTLKLEGTPCRLYASLYSIYSQLPFHIRRPFLHSQSENASCCGDGDPLIIGFQPYHHQIIFLFRRTENYTSLLYFPIILPYYTSILYFPIILPYYTSLLYFPIILPYYTSLLSIRRQIFRHRTGTNARMWKLRCYQKYVMYVLGKILSFYYSYMQRVETKNSNKLSGMIERIVVRIFS